MVNAIFSTIILFSGLLMRHPRSSPSTSGGSGSKATSKLGPWRIFSFAILCVNNFLFLLGSNIVMIHVASYMEEEGLLSRSTSSLLLSFIGLSNIFGRIFLGVLCSYDYFPSLVVYFSCSFLSGLAVLGIAFRNTVTGDITSYVKVTFIRTLTIVVYSLSVFNRIRLHVGLYWHRTPRCDHKTREA